MFGEYGAYCHRKIFALICDTQLFMKIFKGEVIFYWRCGHKDMMTKGIMVTCEELPQ